MIRRGAVRASVLAGVVTGARWKVCEERERMCVLGWCDGSERRTSGAHRRLPAFPGSPRPSPSSQDTTYGLRSLPPSQPLAFSPSHPLPSFHLPGPVSRACEARHRGLPSFLPLRRLPLPDRYHSTGSPYVAALDRCMARCRVRVAQNTERGTCPCTYGRLRKCRMVRVTRCATRHDPHSPDGGA